jgi:hypothetical protein
VGFSYIGYRHDNEYHSEEVSLSESTATSAANSQHHAQSKHHYYAGGEQGHQGISGRAAQSVSKMLFMQN